MFYFEVMEALFQEKVEYLLVGGLSVNLYGVPRVTQDIDLIISMKSENVMKTVHVLKNLGFEPRLPVNLEDLVEENIVKDWIENRNLKAFSFYHPDEPFKVVVIILVHPLEFATAYSRRTVKKLRNIEITLAGIDDLIRTKEFSGRDQDLSDVAMLKKVKRFKEGHE